MLLEPVAAAPSAGVTDAIMLGQAHSLVSAMAAFGAGDQAALQSERQTILPVHRTEPMWGAPALTQ
jgi:hypothetical protein